MLTIKVGSLIMFLNFIVCAGDRTHKILKEDTTNIHQKKLSRQKNLIEGIKIFQIANIIIFQNKI